MPASQEISASPDVKINIGFLPETLFHWYYFRTTHEWKKIPIVLLSYIFTSVVCFNQI